MPKPKKKPSKVVDPEQEVLEEKRKELIRQAQHFTNEIGKESKAKDEFSSRLEEIKAFWDMEKNMLEEKKKEYHQTKDELKSVHTSHQSKIETIREEIKHQLYQQQNDLTEAKNDARIELSKLQDKQANKSRKKIMGKIEYNEKLKEIEISHRNFMFMLQREYDVNESGLQERFKRKFREISVDSERRIRSIREEMETKAKDAVKCLEDAKQEQVKRVEKLNDEKLNQLRQKYNDELHGQLDKIQQLKNDLSIKRKQSRQAEKKSNELDGKNKRIVGPFERAKADLVKLEEDAKVFRSEKQLLSKRKSELKEEEDTLKDLQWKHEVLFQSFELLTKERHKIQKQFEQSILKAQQEKNLTAMMLNEKITMLYKAGEDHKTTLSKMIGESVANEHISIPSSITIQDLEKMQSQMQKLSDHYLRLKRDDNGTNQKQ